MSRRHRRKGRPREIDSPWGQALDGDGIWTKRQAILHARRAGFSVAKACLFAGIAEATYYDEQNRDPEFADQLARARARTELRLMLQIQTAAATDWKAADRALQLIDPDEYGNRLNIKSEHRVEIINLIVGAVTKAIDAVQLPPEIRVRIAEAIGDGITEALGGSGDAPLRALPPHVEAAEEPRIVGSGSQPGSLEAS